MEPLSSDDLSYMRHVVLSARRRRESVALSFWNTSAKFYMLFNVLGSKDVPLAIFLTGTVVLPWLKSSLLAAINHETTYQTLYRFFLQIKRKNKTCVLTAIVTCLLVVRKTVRGDAHARIPAHAHALAHAPRAHPDTTQMCYERHRRSWRSRTIGKYSCRKCNMVPTLTTPSHIASAKTHPQKSIRALHPSTSPRARAPPRPGPPSCFILFKPRWLNFLLLGPFLKTLLVTHPRSRPHRRRLRGSAFGVIS
ncbi:hypothetical protein EVAR_98336_1 [Eumeta japonica]|uniref:Uncharacterized protein n=1 Tax=Eumeta variegata TaxID=151549 RepID=A0A4C1XDN4_EUMVA|nr:hypothetical protein EVAR_98336_1 [Eumeta japonica]